MSLVARHCEANFVPLTADLVAAADIKVSNPAFLPFVGDGSSYRLAALLALDEGEVSSRMHGQCLSSSHPDLVNYFGTPLERRHLDDRRRRVALRSVASDGVHRPAWGIRAITFCPWTFEVLTTKCSTCFKTLDWSRNVGLDRCGSCKQPLTSKDEFVAHHLRQDLRVLSGLLSTESGERNEAITSLPSPFNCWDLNSILDAVCELGFVETTPVVDALKINAALRGGAFEELGPEGLTAGLRFVRNFDQSLTGFAGRAYEEVGSTSIISGFGALSRHFRVHSRKRALSQLLADRLPRALAEAHVPVRRHRTASRAAMTSARTLTLREASTVTGLAPSMLSSLEGRSTTFLARGTARGGTALFDGQAIDELKQALDVTLPAAEAASELGIARYVLPQFVADGLLEVASNHDITIINTEPRVTRTSLHQLSLRLASVPVSDGPGAALKHSLPRRVSPKAWSTVTSALLDGTLAQVARDNRVGLPLSDLRIRIADIKPLQDIISTGPIIGSVTCDEIAQSLGAKCDLISDAVKLGMIDGEVSRNAFSVSLESAQEFSDTFMLAVELAARLGCTPAEARARMRSAGLPHFGPRQRINLWKREAAELELKPLESLRRI